MRRTNTLAPECNLAMRWSHKAMPKSVTAQAAIGKGWLPSWSPDPTHQVSGQWYKCCPVHTFHDKNDNNDKVSINLCQSLSWATFQILCHSCHLCHSAKANRYIYPLVMNTDSDRTRKSACHWPIGLTQRATDSGYQCPHPICVTAWVYIRRHRGWPMPRPIEIVTEWHFGVTFFG